MRRLVHALALVAALALLTTACASDKATGLPSGPTEAPTTAVCPEIIEMNDDLKFVPDNCSVAPGTTVTWRTVGAVPHTSTSEPDAPVEWDSGIVNQNEEFQFTFEEPGEIPYYCELHAAPGLRQPTAMIGTIVVAEA